MSLELETIVGTETGRSAFYKARDNFTTIQAFLNALKAGDIRFDNEGTGLTAENVQAAIVELQNQNVALGGQIDNLGALVGLGGVKESGSNTNGRYVKFEDGTMMCWHTALIGAPNSWGASYKSGIWVYPAAFIAAPQRFISAGQDESGADNVTGNIIASVARGPATTATQTNYSVRNITGIAQPEQGVYCNLFAIGRWKA